MNPWQEEENSNVSLIVHLERNCQLTELTVELHKEHSYLVGHLLTTEPFPFELVQQQTSNSVALVAKQQRVPLPVY